MLLTILMLAMSALFFWAGYVAPPPRPHQYRLRGACYIFLALACFSGYFALREARTLTELARLIEPVPEITDVTYIPSSAEVAVISGFTASVPPGRRMHTGSEERRRHSDTADNRSTGYWLVRTALEPEEVLAFYRDDANRRGWLIGKDTPPWLHMMRESTSLVLYLTADGAGPGTWVLYGFTPASGIPDGS